ncbi:MAG: L-lysine 6-transaminase [Candidatus Marinimicrobia bacterium]|jgi:L-lysine 6-transaminase|nr:L-lysine 6-transaminase [Candidatus Neomarinimicrobiota bacterium]MBT3502274.1 L-lysine 6-transaminase [Candidatus Neomarinimicrobiota bacterium]MBT3840352.1 L-lysine 6-transaminase [Candidatus Neomarinimicrobiota bacterium]MBT3998528.1 L-lysine 6-transaminase [Candidatus Neomarinimicrobiota bacterium]MBT4578990.1 L-lysine 6-transaminase [Candidatus Neomarinimicrobiota bacterium]
MSQISFQETRNSIARYMLADGMSPIVDLEKSHGSWLVDGNTGKEYLDLFSMFASMSIGYNHPYVLANKDRLLSAAINKPTNSDIYSPLMAEFVATMGRVVQPDYLPYSFYVSGGTLAVENALKAAFDWKVRLNIAKGKGEKGSKVLHFKQCFHGRSGYTMSLTDSPDPRKVQYFPKFDWPRVSNPSMIFPMNEANTAKVAALEEQSLNEIKQAILNNPDDIACIILEPIQGEGGDNHFRNDYLVKLKEIALDNDILLIYDEVQTGVGITGKMWAHQNFSDDARPDIISFGKKTQCCGIFAGTRLDEVENNVFNESSRINSTWGGNLVDMVRFTLYLEVIEQERLVQNAAINGEYLQMELQKLETDFEGLVSNVRGSGLFCAYDLPSGSQRDQLINLLQEEGALVLGCGFTSIRFRPHLNITKEEIDLGLSMTRKALARL